MVSVFQVSAGLAVPVDVQQFPAWAALHFVVFACLAWRWKWDLCEVSPFLVLSVLSA